MVSAFAPNRSNQAFDVGILPRGLRCGQNFANAQPCRRFTELIAVAFVPIAQQITWGAVSREGLEQLTADPFSSGMIGDREVDESTTVVRQNHEDKEHPEEDGRNDEEISGDHIRRVVSEEGSPRLRRWLPMTHHIFCDCGLRQCQADLQKLAMNARRTPARIGQAHLADQIDHFRRDGGSALGMTALPLPIQPKPFPVPSDDRFGFDDH